MTVNGYNSIMPHERATKKGGYIMKKETAKTQAAREWLHQNPYNEVFDYITANGKDLLYTEFATVFCHDSDPRYFTPGTYTPLGWAIDAVFVYGYILGMEIAKRGSCQKWLADQQRKK